MISSNTITNYNIEKLSQTLSFCIPIDTKIQTLPMENQLQEMLHYTMDRLRVAGKHTPIIKPYLNTHNLYYQNTNIFPKTIIWQNKILTSNSLIHLVYF